MNIRPSYYRMKTIAWALGIWAVLQFMIPNLPANPQAWFLAVFLAYLWFRMYQTSGFKGLVIFFVGDAFVIGAIATLLLFPYDIKQPNAYTMLAEFLKFSYLGLGITLMFPQYTLFSRHLVQRNNIHVETLR